MGGPPGSRSGPEPGALGPRGKVGRAEPRKGREWRAREQAACDPAPPQGVSYPPELKEACVTQGFPRVCSQQGNGQRCANSLQCLVSRCSQRPYPEGGPRLLSEEPARAGACSAQRARLPAQGSQALLAPPAPWCVGRNSRLSHTVSDSPGTPDQRSPCAL